jgi:hypothetical protein
MPTLDQAREHSARLKAARESKSAPAIQFGNHPTDGSYVVMKADIPVGHLNSLIRGDADELVFDRINLLHAIEDFKQGR